MGELNNALAQRWRSRRRGRGEKRLAHLFSTPSLVADVVNYTSVFDKEFKLHCFQLKQLSHNYSAKVCVHWHVVSSALLFGLLLAAVFSACVCGEQIRTASWPLNTLPWWFCSQWEKRTSCAKVRMTMFCRFCSNGGVFLLFYRCLNHY